MYEALQVLGHNQNPWRLKNSSSFLLFAFPIFADTSRSVLSTALEPSMPYIGEEIFWSLKQLFSSQFCPKTANFNLSETKSLVFAIKKGNFSLFMIIF